MEYIGNRKIKLAKLIIVIAMMVVILFGATYAYYTFFKKVSFQITIENTTFDFIKTNSTFKTNMVLDPSLLKEEEHSGPVSFSGYIQNTVAKATLDLSSSNDMYSCGYEVWLTPTTQSFAGSLIKFTIVGFESMTPYDESGNLVSNAESPVEVFEYTLSDKTLNQEYKIYESRMQSSSRDIVFAYRLYNIAVPESEMGNYSARITLKSKDCKSDGAILVNQTNDNYEPITDDTNVWPKTGETKTYKLSDNVNDTFSVTSSDDSALAVSMGADNQTLTVSKIKPGAMYMEINNTLADTSVKVFFPADYTYFVHDTNPSALAKYNDSTYKYYSENDGNRFFETDSETKIYKFNNINYTFKDSYTYNDMTNVSNRLWSLINYIPDNSQIKNMSYDYDGGYSRWGQLPAGIYPLGKRYYGFDPQNYVWFNNERWRIIGLIPVELDNGIETNLVKIVRDEVLKVGHDVMFKVSHDYKEFLNNFYLNGIYYECKDALDRNVFDSRDVCFDYGFIKDVNTRNMIQPVRWYYFTPERSIYEDSYLEDIAVYSYYNNHRDQSPNYEIQSIGLLDASDIAFAELREDSDYISNDENPVVFHPKLYVNNHTNWLASESTRLNGGWSGDSWDYLYSIFYKDFYSMKHFKPALYLKKEVLVVGGDGSYNRPYILKMEEY